MNNPLLEDHELPPFNSIRAEHVVPAIEALLGECRDKVDTLLAAGESGWEGLIAVIEEQNDRLDRALAPVRHLNAVMNTPELRQAWNTVLPKVSEYMTELKQNPRLFAAYEQIAASDEYKTLGQARQKAVDNAIRDFKLAGIDLPEDQRTRFAQIERRLTEFTNEFNNNVLDATMAWSRHVEDEAELVGLPETALALARQTAEQRGEPGWLLTLDFPCFRAVMNYCEDRAIRSEMYEAFVTRASEVGPGEGKWDNSDVMREILILREEQSRLLGFQNYAEQSLATKMARTPDEVMTFLDDLAGKVGPVARSEFEELSAYARELGCARLEACDVNFYAEKLKQSRFDVSEETLRPWFPVPTVTKGMFEVARRLYDIEVSESHEMEAWHPDVTTYDIVRHGELIARFYIDLYARPGKQGGAWMDECRVRRVRCDGSLQVPVAFLTCNFSAPVGDNPALMTHREVVTLFHEFGHGLHHMLTHVDCADVSGINGVAWDAVELPSQFMENWCWQEEALGFISGHYETGEPLPRELLGKVMAARNFESAMATVRQLEFALFDFRLYLEFDEHEEDPVARILDEVRAQVAVTPQPAYYRFAHSFGHIFGGGYAAGYYSYKWAEVLSADAFSRFAAEGIFNRQTGEQFLSAVLEQGGSVDPMDMFVAFMGREPDISALLRQDGIVQ